MTQVICSLQRPKIAFGRGGKLYNISARRKTKALKDDGQKLCPHVIYVSVGPSNLLFRRRHIFPSVTRCSHHYHYSFHQFFHTIFCSSSASFLCPQNQQSVRWPRHRFFFLFPAFLKYLFHNNVGKEELNMLRANHQTHLRYGSRLARSLGAFITFPWRKIFSGEKNRFRTTTVRRTESC